IEDKLFPKTNSFLKGAAQLPAEVEEFCGKIRAAKDMQVNCVRRWEPVAPCGCRPKKNARRCLIRPENGEYLIGAARTGGGCDGGRCPGVGVAAPAPTAP